MRAPNEPGCRGSDPPPEPLPLMGRGTFGCGGCCCGSSAAGISAGAAGGAVAGPSFCGGSVCPQLGTSGKSKAARTTTPAQPTHDNDLGVVPCTIMVSLLLSERTCPMPLAPTGNASRGWERNATVSSNACAYVGAAETSTAQ